MSDSCVRKRSDTELGVGEPDSPSIERLILENAELRLEIQRLTKRLVHAVEQRDEAIQEAEDERLRTNRLLAVLKSNVRIV